MAALNVVFAEANELVVRVRVDDAVDASHRDSRRSC